MRFMQRSKTVQDQPVDPLVDGLKALTFRYKRLLSKTLFYLFKAVWRVLQRYLVLKNSKKAFSARFK